MQSTSFTFLIGLLVVCIQQPLASTEEDQFQKNHIHYSDHSGLREVSNRSEQFRNRRDAAASKDADHGESKPSASQSKMLSSQLLVINENFFTKEQMEHSEEYLIRTDETHNRVSVFDYKYKILMTKLLSLTYTDLYVHRYEGYKDLRDSGGPQIEQEKCVRQLEHLVERANTNLQLGFRSKDIQFHRLLDTFGRVPAGQFQSDTTWLGSYDACLQMNLELERGEQTRTRYCLASLRLNEWPSEEETLDQVAVYKAAVCLPRACDSISYKNKYSLVQRLLEFNAREVDLNAATVSSIYCLPDEQSSLRIWWKSAPTLLAVSLLTAWLGLLIYATYKDEKLQQQQQPKQKQQPEQQVKGDGTVAPPGGFKTKLYRSLSIASNLRSLFSTDKPSAMMEAGGKSSSDQPPSSGANCCVVKLDVIEGIKVLAAMYIICGHVMMIGTGLIKNGKELPESTSISYTMSNMMPAFAVNSFFTITGILTAYLMFEQNQAQSFVRSPIKWVAFILFRYLRIMPMYALVTLYCKHIARYTGDGPLWDYGTSSLAARRNCEQESWAWTLLFGANFKSPIKHCIPSAWYLANDFQFFIVTPIFLAALHKRPNWGRALLIGAIVAGYIAAFRNVIYSEAHDIRPVASFMPHGFMTYITLLYENYTRPQYRIPAYLVGLLFGHALHNYHQLKRRQLERQQCSSVSSKQASAADSPTTKDTPKTPISSCGENTGVENAKAENTTQDEETSTGWPNWMIEWGTTLCLVAAVTIIITPSVGWRMDLGKSGARILIAFIMPTFHLLYALSVGLYILLATTGHGNQFINRLLSMKFWKPLARLSLCVVLVNVEVIAYIVQTQKTFHSLTNQYHTCLNMLSISCTYLVATVACVLFEAPIRALLNHGLVAGMQRAKTNTKEKAA